MKKLRFLEELRENLEALRVGPTYKIKITFCGEVWTILHLGWVKQWEFDQRLPHE